jgi:hypothetical protein
MNATVKHPACTAALATRSLDPLATQGLQKLMELVDLPLWLKDLFEYWSSGALEIIHKAIQPLGQDDDKGLQMLYQKVLTYEKRKRH